MNNSLWLATAAVLAILISAFWYAGREERVRGRRVAAFLRAAALFLILGGLFLPSLGRGGEAETNRVVLLDTSRSMMLPTSASGSRMDSARAVMRDLSPDLVIGFGANAEQLTADVLAGLAPSAGASRVADGFEAARRLGADSVVVISDGEWDDRREALVVAERLGLGVREINVTEPVSRIGLRNIAAPGQMRAGDSARIGVELFSVGPALPESVTVEVLEDGRSLLSQKVATPGSGRSSRVSLAVVPGAPAGDTEWRRYEVVLDESADPYGVADRRGAWVEITRRATGIVLVALTPDWEARQLLPVARRASTAGALGYLMTAPGRFVRIEPEPRAVAMNVVVGDARSADLLIILGDQDRMSPGLRSAAERQDRLLVFPGEAGTVVGVPARLTNGQSGDWYLDPDITASPISGFLAGLVVDDVPPLSALFEAEGSTAWAPLRARRDRQGSALPVLIGGSRGARRWAIATGAGYWRWSFRGGVPRQLYESLFTAAAGWLLENLVVRVIQLDADPAPTNAPLALRVAAGVEQLDVAVRDSAGEIVWRDTASAGPVVTGPMLGAGSYELEANGRREGTPFRVRRPFDAIDPSRELEPRERVPEMSLAGAASASDRPDGSGRRPVWPFGLAALALCAEWAWRRRIGLR